jgi:hypothetical protein
MATKVPFLGRKVAGNRKRAHLKPNGNVMLTKCGLVSPGPNSPALFGYACIIKAAYTQKLL